MPESMRNRLRDLPGASQVGRGVNELIAAYARVVLRERLLTLAEQVAPGA